MKASITQLRRLETEIQEESGLVASRLYKESSNTTLDTKEFAEKAGIELVTSGESRLTKLISLRFLVRGVIGRFNDEFGINKRTAEIAEHEEIIKMTEDSLLTFGQARRSRNYHTDEVTYSVGISLDKEDELRKSIRVQKRAIQKLKDSCAGTNAQGTIELEDNIVEGLREHGFID